jgi:hypothetical protein
MLIFKIQAKCAYSEVGGDFFIQRISCFKELQINNYLPMNGKDINKAKILVLEISSLFFCNPLTTV